MSRRARFALGALLLMSVVWRATRRPEIVVVGVDTDIPHIRAALREIDGAVRGRLDTVDITAPHRLRVVVRVPPGQRLREEAQFARDRVDDVIMEAHARLAWTRLSAFRTLYANDTVVVTLHRDHLWPIGLPGMGHEMKSRTFRSPWRLGWYGHWPASEVTMR